MSEQEHWEQEKWEFLNLRLDQIDGRIGTNHALLREILEHLPRTEAKMALQWDDPYTPPTSATNAIQTQSNQGDTSMSQATETDVQTIPCSAVETDANGAPVVIDPANASWASSDTSLCTVTTDPTTGNGLFKAVQGAVGTITASLTDTKTGVVGTLGTDNTPETLVISKSLATGKTILTWGVPTP